MLLFGFLLLSTALAVQQNLEDIRPKVCIQEGTVTSLELPKDNETQANSCRELSPEQCRNGVLTLCDKNINGFEKGWYHLQDYQIYSISLGSNKIVEITSEMLNDLPANVTTVSLFNNQVEHLRKEVINNKYVIVLELQLNSIREIDSGALEKMQFLKYLSLERNQLNDTEFARSLPPNLQDLNLCKNAITDLLAGSFAKLGQLRRLSLEFNNITAISQQAFDGLPNLRFLGLSYNNIQEVNAVSFSELGKLQKLLLDHNNIAAISPQTFESLANLKYLALSYNNIQELKAGSFANLGELQKLTLGHNKIAAISQQAFEGLKNLKFLALSYNNIQEVTADSFSNLGELQKLRLHQNKITAISPRAFEDLKNLEHLSLSYNPIKKWNASLSEFNPSLDTILYNHTQYSMATDLNTILQQNRRTKLKIFSSDFYGK